MHKTFIMFCFIFLNYPVYAQFESLEPFLNQVEENNQELKQWQLLMTAKQHEFKSVNALPDLDLVGFYLPLGIHNTTDYHEYQISQTFEFPTVYSVRKRLNSQKIQYLGLEFEIRRQAVLLEATTNYLRLIYLNQQLNEEQKRASFSERAFDLYLKHHASVGKNTKELSKSRMLLAKNRHWIRLVEQERDELIIALQKQNGSKPIQLPSEQYPFKLSITSRDSLWEDILVKDPKIALETQKEELSKLELKSLKSIILPEVTIGYNYQGIAEMNYHGVYAGLKIPLGGKHHKYKADELNLNIERNSEILFEDLRKSFDTQYNYYQVGFIEYQEFKILVDGLTNSEELFLAFETGNLSITDFWDELNFYFESELSLLSMQYNLYQMHLELMRHKL